MMADIIDQAQQLDREFNEMALAAGRKRLNFCEPGEEQLIVDGLHYCLDCGDEIPDARIEAKPDAVRCVDCQGKKERRS